ncbi:MAG: cyanophycin synthetase [Myxococcota bacterium]|nr:cyanophycin synthetase [Myxococcota bacterium]
MARLETLADAERYLDGFVNQERAVSFDYERFGLARIRALLDRIGNPERQLPCIHITGSKGKGTTALASEALLIASGLRTGTYTSPHLESWRERFRIDGSWVEEQRLVSVLGSMLPALEELRRDRELAPSFFDVSTGLALALFRDAGVDAAVIEVGLGGRIDSTNVVASRVSVLTAVQLEHTETLGETRELIAREKVGIARPGMPFLHGPLSPDAHGVVAARAVIDDFLLEEVRAFDVVPAPRGLRFVTGSGTQVEAGILGEHQAVNLALAIRAVEHFLQKTLTRRELEVLRSLRLPARIEVFPGFAEGAVLDCAHTPDSARALRRALAQAWPDRRLVLLVSLARDKDAAGFFAELAGDTRACVLTRAEPTRSAPPEELEPFARAAGIECIETDELPVAALKRALGLLQPGELLVITGSMYLAGVLRTRLAAG